MPDVTLVEGRLSFAFKGVAFAEKYDDWQHYRHQYNPACGGSKAVDFVVSKNGTIWLIEVKDFRQHRRIKGIDLADEVALKVRDTMAGLVSAKFLAKNNCEAFASGAALSCGKMRVALHLEQPSKPSRLFPISVDSANIKMKLRQILRFADPHLEVCNRHSFPAELGAVDSI
jgi:hypothetical protein